MRPKNWMRSPLTLPLAFALSMTTWLATAVVHRVPHHPDDGLVWIYVSALCAVAGDPSDCRPTGQSTIRTFDDRDACVAHLNAELSTAGDPRLMGSCLRRPEA
jgi:hypothetical protein